MGPSTRLSRSDDNGDIVPAMLTDCSSSAPLHLFSDVAWNAR